jgi:hypothetical protein
MFKLNLTTSKQQVPVVVVVITFYYSSQPIMKKGVQDGQKKQKGNFDGKRTDTPKI